MIPRPFLIDVGYRNAKLETTTTKYLPDTLHLNGAGYDIVTPYIIEALENFYDPDYNKETEDTTTAGGDDVTTKAPDDDTTANTPDSNTQAPDVTTTVEDSDTTTDKKSCGSFNAFAALASVVIAALGSAVVLKKKY